MSSTEFVWGARSVHHVLLLLHWAVRQPAHTCSWDTHVPGTHMCASPLTHVPGTLSVCISCSTALALLGNAQASALTF
jgi:hypothetical protein